MSDVAAPATITTTAPADARIRLQQIAGVALFAAITAGGLLYAKWWPYSHKLAHLFAGAAYPGRSITGNAWHFTVAYGRAVWVALAAALLIGAGLETLLPRAVLTRALGNSSRRFSASLAAGAASMPCMMCTCCSAPVVRSMRRSGVSNQAALSFWLGNPLLNPAVVVILALVLPWQYAASRILVGAAIVFVAAPLISRLAPNSPHRHDAAITPVVHKPKPAGYFAALARLAVVLIPEYFVVVLLVGTFRGALPALVHDPAGWGLLAALAVATIGTLIVVPTAGEVPVVVGLAAAGLSPIAAGAAMIALPALSLPSMVMVGRSLSWRVVAFSAGTVAAAALCAGGLVMALGA